MLFHGGAREATQTTDAALREAGENPGNQKNMSRGLTIHALSESTGRMGVESYQRNSIKPPGKKCRSKPNTRRKEKGRSRSRGVDKGRRKARVGVRGRVAATQENRKKKGLHRARHSRTKSPGRSRSWRAPARIDHADDEDPRRDSVKKKKKRSNALPHAREWSRQPSPVRDVREKGHEGGESALRTEKS